MSNSLLEPRPVIKNPVDLDEFYDYTGINIYSNKEYQSYLDLFFTIEVVNHRLMNDDVSYNNSIVDLIPEIITRKFGETLISYNGLHKITSYVTNNSDKLNSQIFTYIQELQNIVCNTDDMYFDKFDEVIDLYCKLLAMMNIRDDRGNSLILSMLQECDRDEVIFDICTGLVQVYNILKHDKFVLNLSGLYLYTNILIDLLQNISDNIKEMITISSFAQYHVPLRYSITSVSQLKNNLFYKSINNEITTITYIDSINTGTVNSIITTNSKIDLQNNSITLNDSVLTIDDVKYMIRMLEDMINILNSFNSYV